MGLSTEQTVAVIEAVGDLVDSTQPDAVPIEPQGWLIPLVVTVVGGVITTIFGVWYTKRRKRKG